MIRVENLYRHKDGGLYCLLSDDAPLKEPTEMGIWHDGVIYMGKDGRMRSTTKARWDDRFTHVPAIHEDKLDADEMAMIRRCNPGDHDLDFIRIFESWSESEMNVTGHMLELAVAATVERFANVFPASPIKFGRGSWSLTITTEDLQRVAQNYEIERIPEGRGFRFVMRKSFP